MTWPEVAKTMLAAGYSGTRIQAALDVLERTGDYNAARAALDGERSEPKREADHELLEAKLG